MKKSFIKYLAVSAVMLGAGLPASAYTLPAGDREGSVIQADVTDIRRTDNGQIAVDMNLDLTRVRMKSNVEMIYTPMFTSGSDTLKFQPFSVTGRNRMYWDRRNDRLMPVTFYEGKLLDSGDTNAYSAPGMGISPVQGAEGLYTMALEGEWMPWMEVAEFSIGTGALGCANCVKNIEGVAPLYALARTDFTERTYFPEFVYETPVAEAVKMRDISARAYIDFPVNKTEILPDFRRNPAELAKIRNTIDSVKNDKDITVTKLHISGTASPEGSYQNNVRLAKGRTEALKNYVQGLYRFPVGLITTSFEPVDWTGLADFLKDAIKGGADGEYASILPHAEQILGIVDSDIEPVVRNQKIRSTYPKEYAWLLANVYPGLRHSDYRIEFEIKTYTEVSEILAVMAESPQKLSLAELFVAANSQQPGSETYNRAFELAVTMYPQDPTANLNAAVAAMRANDLAKAQRYLDNVKTPSAEADYARAVLTLMQGDAQRAEQMFGALARSSNQEVATKAQAAAAGLEEVRIANATNYFLIEE